MQSFKAQLLNPIRPGNMWSFDANNHFMMILKNVLMWLEMLSRNVHIACKSFYMAPIEAWSLYLQSQHRSFKSLN